MPPHPVELTSQPHHNTMVLNIACNIATRQIVWVRNGDKILSGTAVTWAAMGRQGKI